MIFIAHGIHYIFIIQIHAIIQPNKHQNKMFDSCFDFISLGDKTGLGNYLRMLFNA